RAGLVRMRVALGRLAVRGPARVTDADATRDRSIVQRRLEIAELADRAPDRDRAFLEDRDAGGVVAAVLEPPQRVEDHLLGVLTATDVADDSAHGFALRREGVSRAAGACARPSQGRCAAWPARRRAPRSARCS